MASPAHWVQLTPLVVRVILCYENDNSQICDFYTRKLMHVEWLCLIDVRTVIWPNVVHTRHEWKCNWKTSKKKKKKITAKQLLCFLLKPRWYDERDCSDIQWHETCQRQSFKVLMDSKAWKTFDALMWISLLVSVCSFKALWFCLIHVFNDPCRNLLQLIKLIRWSLLCCWYFSIKEYLT